MSKFRNVRTQGYASKREANRAAELKLLEKAGEITDLKEQVKIELIPAQYVDGKCVERACTYIADFVFKQNGKEVVEDVKGFREPIYRIKRKIALFLKGIRIVET